ncbi:MAG: PTS sugar transporter subunit IIB [Clostridia bacterium]|nr:PTS sugar transporter subunit IIB [Clostridia bacterium]
MAIKKVLVCCGTGVATSVQVSNKIKDLLKQRGIKAEVAECKAVELPSRVSSYRPDLVVSTTQVNESMVDARVFPGLPFLTGIGVDAAMDEIVSHLSGAEG